MCWRTQLLWTDSGEVMELWPCGFKIEYTHLGFASAGAVWLGIWNSDHVVLKLIIRTSASPRQQQSHWGLTMTQDAYFSFLTHTKQLLLVTFCETTAGNWKKWKCDVRTDVRTYGRTDRHEVWNSYLDVFAFVTLNLKDATVRNRLPEWHFICPRLPQSPWS